ncbi:hypothetical protein MMC27_002542 [Xylographa pallens]|nr:hypothetical protein [Xylographa pallens]
MPPPLLSILERPEPTSPTSSHPPPPTNINAQPPTQPPLTIPPSPSLPPPTPHSPKRPLPHQVLDLLCLPYRKRATPKTPPPPSPPPHPHPPSCAPRPHRRRRTSFDTRYHSFPPPVFTGRDQPRALDSRLYPELLADEADEHPSHAPAAAADDETHPFWRARSHLWAETAAAQRSEAGGVLAPDTGAHPALGADREDSAAAAPTTTIRIPPERHHSNPAPPPRNAPPRLVLRGGGGGGAPVRLPDAQHLPPITWRLAGGRGPPPTAGEYRAWRARERERIAEANAQNGREGKEGRGFWREVWWVLGGARWEGRRRRGGGDGGGDGDGESGGSGSTAAGEGSGGGGDGAGGVAGGGA